MAPKVLFVCPRCDVPSSAPLVEPVEWKCSACDQFLHLEPQPKELPHCAVCGNHEIYKQKDFPQRFGLGLLVIAFVASIFTYGYYHPVWTWSILIGTAIFDGALYLMVGDALVCYRCHAYHKGFETTKEHEPFEITVGERYRQERLRKERP